MKKIKISELKFDERLAKLRSVNLFTVSQYQQNIRAGAQFPPIVVDVDNMVVSGNHRARAYLNEYGADHEIDVEVRDYTNWLSVLKDFTIENITHGAQLSAFNKRQISLAMVAEGATNEEIAEVLNLPVGKIVKDGARVVSVIGTDGGVTVEPVKRGPAIVGPISIAQYTEHKSSDRGITFSQNAREMTRWLTNGWVEATDENIALANELAASLRLFV